MNPSRSSLIETIRQFSAFNPVPPEQLSWLVEHAAYMQPDEGEYIFRKGEPINKMIVVLQGKIVFLLHEDDEPGILSEAEEGEITGALPYSRAKVANNAVQSKENTALLCLPKICFPEMIRAHYELTEVLVHAMTSRVRKFTHSQEQTEKMGALGKLAAGLTHELNNPAAAVLRSSASLKTQLLTLPGLLQQISGESSAAGLFSQLEKLIQSSGKGKETSAALSLLEKSAQEDELAEWLAAHQIDKPYEIAENLTAQQISIQDLEPLEAAGDAIRLKAGLQCFSLFISIIKLADDIQLSSSRMSELVNAVKAYTHMDKSPERENTDIHKGIENTLTILNFKIKRKNIRLKTNFQKGLPAVCVYNGELNQLWTNLIDNALDAMDQNGTLTISTGKEEDWVKVDIEDNGKGISKELQQQIFEPFFTTKGSGKGSGMGLDIAKKIVDHHDGKIELDSEKGNTRFRIFLPL